jgi:hypothetical protein
MPGFFFFFQYPIQQELLYTFINLTTIVSVSYLYLQTTLGEDIILHILYSDFRRKLGHNSDLLIIYGMHFLLQYLFS